jgi:hypothetical protein
MSVREENRNVALLAVVTLFSLAVAGGVALLDPAPAAQPVAGRPAYLADSTPVRIVGAPFVPNTDPHRR